MPATFYQHSPYSFNVIAAASSSSSTLTPPLPVTTEASASDNEYLRTTHSIPVPMRSLRVHGRTPSGNESSDEGSVLDTFASLPVPNEDSAMVFCRGHRRNLSAGTDDSERRTPKHMAHGHLLGFLGYIDLPSPAEAEALGLPNPKTGITTRHSVFFGQCRFEMTPRQMMWLVLHLSQGTCVPTYLHPRGNGCFTAYFRTQQEADYVRGFHECLLCDHNGVWIARSEEEKATLVRFLQGNRPRVPRLPHGAIIIRE